MVGFRLVRLQIVGFPCQSQEIKRSIVRGDWRGPTRPSPPVQD
jgi:hypothetical protein